MGGAESNAPGAGPTPGYLRLIFAVAALGLGVQWFDRLDRVRGGASAGWLQVWDWVALCALPFGVGYFAWRAVTGRGGRAEPAAAADGGGR
jgi:hypothetical protein